MLLIDHVSLDRDGLANTVLLILVTHNYLGNILVLSVGYQSQLPSKVLDVMNFGGVGAVASTVDHDEKRAFVLVDVFFFDAELIPSEGFAAVNITKLKQVPTLL